MRCNSCGEINDPAATICRNCGAKLTGVVNQDPMRRTVIQSIRKCPMCDYSVLDHSKTCPNCGAPIQPQPSSPQTVMSTAVPRLDAVKCSKCGKEVPGEYLFCPYCSSPIPRTTIAVGKYRNRMVGQVANPEPEQTLPQCSLTLIPDEDEQKTELQHKFEGETIILNRSNTEPENLTITSKEQAILTNEGGRWYILNHSEMGSTFVEASRKMELQAGDVILLGDRRFRFDPK